MNFLQAVRKNLGVLVFSAIYTVAFATYYIYQGDFEFLWYVAVLVGLFLLILFTLNRSKFDRVALWGLSLWGLLHMAGGGIVIGGNVLYAFTLIPFVTDGEMTILKYDQFVHMFGFGVATVVGWQLLSPHLLKTFSRKAIYFLLILIGAGFGVLNEIVEFIAVLSFPETGVGGYVNTSLDLVSNTVGAIAAVFFIHYYYVKKLR
ncbi:MAG: DUF2238 domain-containing protein [Candidatus Paceibacterota bacterium]